MKTLGNWEPCYTDPIRGVTFFGGDTVKGIAVEADPITDPRWDRVLPILEEEQIFMCRQMDNLLVPGKLVLDVGTGSGVFAVYAAKKGCKVVAIDISPRALRVAHQNAEKNKVSSQVTSELEPVLGNTYKQMTDGTIRFELADFNTLADALENKSRFDVIFLAPPYNPTCPGVSPALHAEAGENGQEIFNWQIEKVCQLLRLGGVCIGNQMSVSEAGSPIQAIEKITCAFPEGCSVRFTHILKDNAFFPTTTFLNSQYRNFLAVLDESQLQPRDENDQERWDIAHTVARYIEGVAAKHQHLSLVYYEVQRTNDGRMDVQEFQTEAKPDKDWQDRIWLHRSIVDHTSTLNSFPSPALFMEMDAISSLPSSESLDDPNSKQKDQRWLTSTLRPVDQWLKTSGALAGECERVPQFDAIVVDTAPYFSKKVGDIRSLPQECKVWLSQTVETRIKSDGGKVTNFQEQFIANWRFNTRALQRAKIGPFLHPHFTGHNAPRQWRGIQYSELNAGATVGVKDYERDVFNSLKALLRTAEADVSPHSFNLREGIEAQFGYGWEKLQAFDINNERLFIESYQERLNASLKLLQRDSAPSAEQQSKEIARDLELCHLVMHNSLRGIIDDDSHIKAQWSALVGVPFSLNFENDDTRGVPSNYRGGLWVYVCSSQKWTYGHQRLLLDLVKLLWVLYGGKYGSNAEGGIAEVASNSLVKAFGHEVKHVSNAIGQKWMPKPKDLFEVTYNPTGADSSKMGRIELWNKEDEDELTIVPVKSLMEDATRQINFWCMSDNPRDVPFNERPADIRKFLQACCNAAINDLAVHAFSGTTFETVQDVRQVKSSRKAIREIFSPVEVHGDTFPAIQWEFGEESNPTVWLARTFVAIFKNYARHGEPSHPVIVTFKELAPEHFRVRIENCGRLDCEATIAALKRKGYDPGVAERAVRQLDKASQLRKDLQTFMQGDFKSKQVVKNCLKELNGEIKIWQSEAVAPGAPFFVEIELQYSV